MYRVLKRSAILCGCIVRSPFLSVPTLHTHNEEHLIREKRIQATYRHFSFFQTYIKQSHESPTSRQSYHTKTEALSRENNGNTKFHPICIVNNQVMTKKSFTPSLTLMNETKKAEFEKRQSHCGTKSFF